MASGSSRLPQAGLAVTTTRHSATLAFAHRADSAELQRGGGELLAQETGGGDAAREPMIRAYRKAAQTRAGESAWHTRHARHGKPLFHDTLAVSMAKRSHLSAYRAVPESAQAVRHLLAVGDP